MALQRAVAGRVIRDAVLPTAPHDSAPATAEGADRAGVVVPAGAGGGVQVLRPRVMVAAGVRERDERLAQALVAGPTEAAALRLPDSTATAAWPASPARVSRVG